MGTRDVLQSLRTDTFDVSKKLYYIAFTALSLSRGIDKISFTFSSDLLGRVFQVIALVLLVPPLCRRWRDFSNRTKWFLRVLILLEAMSYLISRYTYLIWATLFLICSKKSDLRRLASIALCTSCAIVIFAGIMYMLGQTDADAVYRGNIERLSFGFSHPNCFGEYLLRIQLSMLVIRFGSIRYIEIGITLLFSIIAGVFADSKTTVIGLIVALLSFIWMQQRVRKGESAKRIAKVEAFLSVLLAIFSVGAMIIYSKDSPVLRSIDVLLSGRLEYPNTLFTQIGLSPLGFNIAESGKYVSEWSLVNGVVPVDNAYISLLINQGVILFSIILVGLIILVWNLGRLSEADGCIVAGFVLVAMLIALSESYVLDITFSYCLLSAGLDVFGNISKEDAEKGTR